MQIHCYLVLLHLKSSFEIFYRIGLLFSSYHLPHSIPINIEINNNTAHNKIIKHSETNETILNREKKICHLKEMFDFRVKYASIIVIKTKISHKGIHVE